MCKRNVVLSGLLVLTALGVFVIAAPPGKEKPLVCVGVFDSRAVALAWGRSDDNDVTGDLMAEYEKAKAAGDTDRMKELEKEGHRRQDVIHKQVFGNEPIDNVLAIIEKDLPKIAEDAGADILVSKWEIAYQKKSAKFVDVTSQMAQLFDPDEKTLEIMKQLLDSPPVPTEQLEEHKH